MIDAATREFVADRANHRCEYCLLSRADYCWSFHVEHIVPRQHGGSDSLGNLAYACPRCNRYKGPNLTAIDPHTGRIEELFHPRINTWEDHFQIARGTIIGISGSGRATVRLLQMNDENRCELRRELLG